jgi:thermitase
MNRLNIPWYKAASVALFGCSSLIATAQPAPAPISPPSRLTAEATSPNTIELNWSGAKTDQVEIYRGDALLTSPEANDGSYTDRIDREGGGSYLYKVCEAGSTACSNIASVIF